MSDQNRLRDGDPPVTVKRSRLYTAAAVLVSALVAGAVCGLVFGPARGARADIGQVRTDLHATRANTFGTLSRITAQLKTTQRSLTIQKQGLVVAANAEQYTHTTSDNTTQLLGQTTATLDTIRHVLSALGPLKQLHGDIAQVTRDVHAGVVLARTTLATAQQTLRTGQAALVLAGKTLGTLRQSLHVQQQVLVVERKVLEQTKQINRKIPLPADLPSLPAATGSGN